MKDGGPAFPFHVHAVEGEKNAVDFPGLSIRDYFAAAAINGILSQQGMTIDISGEMLAESRARLAYAIADAMLKAREEEK